MDLKDLILAFAGLIAQVAAVPDLFAVLAPVVAEEGLQRRSPAAVVGLVIGAQLKAHIVVGAFGADVDDNLLELGLEAKVIPRRFEKVRRIENRLASLYD